MTDQADIAGRFMHSTVESAGPDAIADVIKAHAVCAAGKHSRVFYFFLYA